MDLVFTFSLFCKILKMSSPVFCQQRKMTWKNDFFYEQSAQSGISTSPPVHLILPISVSALSPPCQTQMNNKGRVLGKKKFTGSKLSHNTENRHRWSMSERQIAWKLCCQKNHSQNGDVNGEHQPVPTGRLLCWFPPRKCGCFWV